MAKSRATQANAWTGFVSEPSTFPPVYGLPISGSHMAPEYTNGCVARIDRDAVYRAGDVVAVWYRPEVLKPGSAQAMFMRVVIMPSFGRVDFPYNDHPDSEVQSVVMLGSDDKPDTMLPVRCSWILAIHKAVGAVSREEMAL
ncbi:hypothetical protein [Beijerinckia sp. L45]|uniref:hypothetical protein n=1 Tax=Beijerinckia sp. L45 TaxID=1641855 RepID=UPI00131C4AFB|nr:hypothetical protein [Beijerinckia sp. L45]